MICEYCEGDSTIDPLKDFRDYHAIFLADVDGMIWASNSYWAVPVPDSLHRIARLFLSYNLSLEPGTYGVSDTLTRDESAPVKDIQMLVLSAVPEKLERVQPVRFNGADVYVKGTYDGELLAVFEIPGGMAVVNHERLRLVERLAPKGEWYASADPMAMFVRKADDRVTAVLMPMRHKANGK